MVSLFDGVLPDFVVEFKIFALFPGGVGELSIGPESRIANSFVNHSQLYLLNGNFYQIN